jgi:hypothetical protein
MEMFGLRKRCAYCGMRIDKGKEIVKEVKVPGGIGTRPRAFCSEEHAAAYEKEIQEEAQTVKHHRSGGGCCG